MNKNYKRRALLAGASIGFAVACAGVAQAAPVLHVTKSVVIDAPASKVWAIAKDFPTLTWVPAVKSSTATKGNIVGSVRTLNLGGPVLTEQLAHYQAARMRYSYFIQHTASNMKVLPVRDYYSTISVVKLGPDKCKATWTGHFKRVDQSSHPKSGMDDQTATTAITGIYTSGLANLAKLAAQ